MAKDIFPGVSGRCYWGHTDNSEMTKLCEDGRNNVCPQCCHEDCRSAYPGLYRSCQSKGWPVWPLNQEPRSQAGTKQCYWKHTMDPSRMKLCTDGRNYVCEHCCHDNCSTKYPAMNGSCREKGWPVWPPSGLRDSIPSSSAESPNPASEVGRKRKLERVIADNPILKAMYAKKQAEVARQKAAMAKQELMDAVRRVMDTDRKP